MSDPNDQLTASPHSALLQSVQQFNQPRIIGKLLHDLRNPVHSVRIAVELFGRVASAGPEGAKLLEKAGRYAAPAESAVAALGAQIDRMALYVGPPVAPAPQPIAIDAWLADIAALLRESTHQVDASVESQLAEDVAAVADVPRLSHGVLHWALTRTRACTLRAAEEGAALRLHVEGAGAADAHEGAATDAQLQRLIEEAGGSCELRGRALEIVLRRVQAQR